MPRHTAPFHQNLNKTKLALSDYPGLELSVDPNEWCALAELPAAPPALAIQVLFREQSHLLFERDQDPISLSNVLARTSSHLRQIQLLAKVLARAPDDIAPSARYAARAMVSQFWTDRQSQDPRVSNFRKATRRNHPNFDWDARRCIGCGLGCSSNRCAERQG